MNALQSYPFQHWSHRTSHNGLRSVCHTNGLVFGVKRFWFCLGASCNEYTKQTDLECFKPNVFPKNVLRESITPSKTLKTFEIDPGAVSIVCSMVSHNSGSGIIETTLVWDWKIGLEGSKKHFAQKNLWRKNRCFENAQARWNRSSSRWVLSNRFFISKSSIGNPEYLFKGPFAVASWYTR